MKIQCHATPGASLRFMVLLGIIVFLLPGSQAYPESEAPRVRMLERGMDDVVAVWHEPEIVQPGTQWNGFIQFREGHGITEVTFQICDVGRVCFAPPVQVERINETTWMFDTNAYQKQGEPINYQSGWRLGTQFVLTERMPNGTVETYKFPQGIENPDDLEYHYFAFDMPAEAKGTPAPGILGIMTLMTAVALRRR